MSAEAMAWVWANSSYTGTALVLHLAVADVANDLNHNLLWINPITLAEKANTTRETASRWLWKAVEDGLLEVTVDRRRGERDEHGHRKTSEFRFLTPRGAKPRDEPSREEADLVTNDHEETGVLVTNDHEPCDEPSQVTQAKRTQGVVPYGTTRRGRKPDPIWDALVDACGLRDKPITASERGRLNKACKELREVGASPEEITARARSYRRKFPTVSLTALALTANWSTCTEQARPATPTGPVYRDSLGNRVAMTPRGVW